MKSWNLLLVVLVGLLLMSGGPLPARAEAVQLTEANNNQTVTVDQGKTLDLFLPSNPTTGYDWSIAGSPDPNVLVKISDEYIPNTTTSQAIGSGGNEHWVFQAAGSGATAINLVYARPWESVQPAKTYSVEIKVNPSPVPAPSQLNHARFVIGSSNYYIDGQAYLMDAPPILKDSRVYVPVRYLSLALGLPADRISWDASARSVILPPNQNGAVFQLKIGDRNIYQLDSQGAKTVKVMDVAPVIVNGRTYLPARFITELFGYQVGWDTGNKTVLIDQVQK